MSSNADILLAASQEVDLEASNKSFDNLLLAAEEVAGENGMPSPMRQTHSKTAGFADTGDGHGNMMKTSDLDKTDMLPKKDLSASPTRSPALPKGRTVRIDEDRNAVNDLAIKMAKTVGSRPIEPFTASQPVRTSYGKKRVSYGSSCRNHVNTKSYDSAPRDDLFGTGPIPRGRSVSQKSELADFLAKSTDKPWEERLQSSFSSYSQEVLFRTMMQPRPAESKGKPKSTKDAKSTKEKEKKKSSRRNDLSKQFASLDDAKECTFKPIITKNPMSEGGETKDASFLDRMEMKEADRRRSMERAIGEADYKAVVDKKQCPNCGANQSYEEVKEKKKNCPNCNVEYTSKIQWGDVQRRFFNAQQQAAKKKDENMEKVKKDIEEETLMKRYSRFDRMAGKVIVNQEALDQAREGGIKWNEDMEAEFFARMSEQYAAREGRLKELDKTIMKEQYPFKPDIPKRNDDDSDDEGGFMRRLQESVDKKVAMAAKARKSAEAISQKPPIAGAWKPIG
jgi:hypothetical protein